MHSPATRRGLSVLAALGVGLAASGCDEHTGTPTSPLSDPALARSMAGVEFVQLSTGGGHTCGVTAAGRAYCWGGNSEGQLGDGTTTQRLTPTPVTGSLVFRAVSAGQVHTCGVTTDVQVYCWGFNQAGALGDGTVQSRPTPTPVVGGRRFRTVEAGSHWTCALTEPGRRAYCWGTNRQGQLGDGSRTDRLVPVAVTGNRELREISLGAFHTCGVTRSYKAYCWGSDTDGKLGDGSEMLDHLTPSPVAGGLEFAQIDAGVDNTCAVTTDHRAFCWGTGGIGDGKTLARFTPRAVAGGIGFERVTAGFGHACGESTAGKAYCWGANDFGKLGDGSSEARLKPVAVKGGLTFAQLSSNSKHTCGRTPAAVAYCWGWNRDGQLGDGTSQNRSSPTLVAGAN